MSWQSRVIEEDQVIGFGGALLTNVMSGSFDDTEITDERLSSARSLVEEKLLDPKVGNMIDVAGNYSSQTAFLDALDGLDTVSEQLDRMLVYAFIHVYAFDQRNSNNDVFSETARKFDMRLDSTTRSFALLARKKLKTQSTGDDYTGINSSTHDTTFGW